MMIRSLSLAVLAALAAPAAASAQNHSLNFSIGYFAVRGEDARVDDDVLLQDLSVPPPLLFEIGDFNGATVGAEWLVSLGRHIEAGAGIGYYRRTVPTIYAELTRADGSEIEQDLKLRIAPVTATIRFLPLGRGERFEPFIGGGVGVFTWRYSETGDFVASNNDIFRARFVESGNDVGAVILGGLRYVADPWLGGVEVRYQRAEGTLPTDGDNAFLGGKIDLTGWTTNFTVGIRF